MPYANINVRRERQKQQYQQKKIDYIKQDKLNENNDKRNYGNGHNKKPVFIEYDPNNDEIDTDEDDSENDSESESETDDEYNEYNDELLDYLLHLMNYKMKKGIEYKLATGASFNGLTCNNPIFWSACLKHGFIPMPPNLN